jgi:cytochrome c oxidase subunit III
MTGEIDERRSDGKMGMWLFLCSEIILFGGLFLLYAVYRLKNPDDFHNASLGQSRFWGTLNTCILITSSLLVALSVYFGRRGAAKKTLALLSGTILLGLGFLGIKAYEWTEKITSGIYPGADALLSRPKGEMLYHGLYYLMTGLHAVHVFAGISVLAFMSIRVLRAGTRGAPVALLENAGLYWHLVDIIWIFLFPLIYLIG